MGKDSNDTHIQIFINLMRSNEKISKEVFTNFYKKLQQLFRIHFISEKQEDYLDLIDEAFIVFWEKRNDFRGHTAGEFRKYFHRILLSVLNKRRRKEKTNKSLDDMEKIEDCRKDFKNTILENEETKALSECISNLSNSHQQIVHELLAGTKKGVIAGMVGISQSQLTELIHEIFYSLRKCLMEKGYSRQLLFQRN